MALASLQKSRAKAFHLLLGNKRNAKGVTVSAEDENSIIMQAYLTELVNNIIKQEKLLDYYIERVSGRKKSLLGKGLLTALRFGFYFLLFDSEMPEYAAVNESVMLLKGKKEKGFLNAVLRKYIRDKSQYEPSRSGSIKDIAIRFSHPEWFVKFAVGKFGHEKAISVFQANNSVPPVWLRLNLLKSDRESLERFLKSENIAFERDKDIDFLYKTYKIRGLLYKKLFEEGAFYVQDKTTVLPCLYLDRFEGSDVLDICSAPGGKATLTAQLLGGGGRVLCIDRTAEKTRLIERNARRLGLHNIEIVQCDFLKNCDKIGNRLFGKILVDVPCSNTGAWRKRPEARWLFTPSRFREVTGIQKEILIKALSLLAKNGVLVYSTCSVLDIENRDIVLDAINRDRELELTYEKLTLQETGGSEGGYFAAIRRS